MDLHLTILEETQNKPLRSRWVPSHRDIATAKTKEERIEIKRNDEVDRLAKMATGLPLPEYTPTHPGHLWPGHARLMLSLFRSVAHLRCKVQQPLSTQTGRVV